MDSQPTSTEANQGRLLSPSWTVRHLRGRIQVVLPVQTRLSSGAITGSPGTLNFRLRYSTSAAPGTLPNSPLYKKHNAKLEIDLVSARAPFRLVLPTAWQEILLYSAAVLPTQPEASSMLAKGSPIDLPLVLRQRVKVQDYPFTLTVPIGDKSP